MNKLRLAIGGTVLILIALSIGGYYFFRARAGAQPVITPDTQEEAPKEKDAELTTWNDSAGFTFQYPKDLVVNKHEEDQQNYAHVELTNASQPGKVIVWVKDTTAKDLPGWVKAEKTFAGASVLDSALGEQPAKKVLVNSATGKTLYIGTLYDGLLFMVEGTQDDAGYWTQVHDTVASSFAFVSTATEPAGAGSPAGGGSTEESVDEEEVVE